MGKGGMGKGCINKDFKWMHVVPDTGISNKAMPILNSFVKDFFEHIATHTSNLATYSKMSTISSWEIQAAVWEILLVKLLKHTVSLSTKSVAKFTSKHPL